MNVFKSELIKNAEFCGDWDIPLVKSANEIPMNLVSFSNRNMQPKEKSWMHFFINDEKFECLWNNPERYLNTFRRNEGVIGPDFSLYRNMPLSMQLWNVYRNRAISSWLVAQGVKVIPCVRWGSVSSFSFCFDGIEKNSIVAIGNHGCYADRYDRAKFLEGLCKMIDTLSPKGIVLYGTASKTIQRECTRAGILLQSFSSDFNETRKGKGTKWVAAHQNYSRLREDLNHWSKSSCLS